MSPAEQATRGPEQPATQRRQPRKPGSQHAKASQRPTGLRQLGVRGVSPYRRRPPRRCIPTLHSAARQPSVTTPAPPTDTPSALSARPVAKYSLLTAPHCTYRPHEKLAAIEIVCCCRKDPNEGGRTPSLPPASSLTCPHAVRWRSVAALGASCTKCLSTSPSRSAVPSPLGCSHAVCSLEGFSVHSNPACVWFLSLGFVSVRVPQTLPRWH